MFNKIIVDVPIYMGTVSKKIVFLPEDVREMVSALKTIQGYCVGDSAGHMEYFKGLCDRALRKLEE
jgi:hypothetical protein